ncbi:MAG TPA: HPr-rel-A system PqqD family peptide chaperone [Ktedonobacteraceae bacterium]|nr:HPr-rel-A system PqqD family peptide chaperone [Ktedonobacteraceae bacterium]
MRYQRLPHVSVQEMGFEGDVMVYNLERGTLHILNMTAAAVLVALEEPKTSDEVIAALSEEYEIDQATVHEEILAIVREFEQHGLIQQVHNETEVTSE